MNDNLTSIEINKRKAHEFSILVVDDEPDLLELIAEELAMSGFKVLTASSGNKAFAMIKENRIDLIITDIRMPDGDGIELIRNVKTINHKAQIICVTGNSVKTHCELIDMGALAVFDKPFYIKKVQTIIYNALGISPN